MTPRVLGSAVRAFRIGDPNGQFPVFSDGGAREVEGRWHRAGASVIYLAEHYSTAMLEKLAHWNGVLPANQHFVEVEIPAGVSYEVVTPDVLPDWHLRDGNAARDYGMGWYEERRSAVLFVPSVVARMERNIILNSQHPDFAKVRCELETPVWWDDRLFR